MQVLFLVGSTTPPFWQAVGGTGVVSAKTINFILAIHLTSRFFNNNKILLLQKVAGVSEADVSLPIIPFEYSLKKRGSKSLLNEQYPVVVRCIV